MVWHNGIKFIASGRKVISPSINPEQTLEENQFQSWGDVKNSRRKIVSGSIPFPFELQSHIKLVKRFLYGFATTGRESSFVQIQYPATFEAIIMALHEFVERTVKEKTLRLSPELNSNFYIE